MCTALGVGLCFKGMQHEFGPLGWVAGQEPGGAHSHIGEHGHMSAASGVCD